ncbi:MAG: stalk domain-containing protein [Defluviitaleaceae bacterium]|nr:stalk domain-containing protein [Defluviitaleaceae bacterium]
MKKFLITTTLLSLSSAFSTTVLANSPRVTINGSEVNFANQQPVIIDGRTLVPVRGVFEQLGFQVNWDEQTNTAILNNGTINVVINANGSNFTANGQTITPDVPQRIINGSMMLPLRAVSEAANVNVDWNVATSTIAITTSSPSVGTGSTAGSVSMPSNIVPRSPSRAGSPQNPAISATRAVELAVNHLNSLGVASARFDYIYMDWDNGRWVWSIEFDGAGRSYEFYIDVNTGALVLAPTLSSNQTQNVGSSVVNSNHESTSNQQTNQGNITRERAAEIAQGVVSGTLIEVDRDFERGRQVWYVAIRSGGLVHEVYVDIITGEIVLHQSYSD